MDNIIEPTMDYDFSKLYLGPPSTLAGGSYFTRLMYNSNKILYIQTPKSLTKQGFVKSGKKIYVDLMFDNNDTVFIHWIENLEAKCQELIFEKSDKWFETKLEKDDIESAFTSPFKIFKSGKFYLLRANVKPTMKVYNDSDEMVNLEDIGADKTIISILEVQGIKFSPKNFQIEIELKQAMVVSPDPFLDECFIKKPIKRDLVKLKEGNSVLNTPDKITPLEQDTKLSDKLPDKLEENISLDIVEVDEKKPVPLTNSDNTIDNKENRGNKENKTFDAIIDETIDEAIDLEIEDLGKPQPKEVNTLTEVDLSDTLENSLETLTLKKPNEVYYEIYCRAREKAKEAKKNALAAYLELKNIKKTYMLDDIDDSDSDFDEEEDEEEEEGEEEEEES
jgi:hypothetical protein